MPHTPHRTDIHHDQHIRPRFRRFDGPSLPEISPDLRLVHAPRLPDRVDLIAAVGGGVVEAYPQDTPGKNASATFLYSATRPMFERAGFAYQRPKGKNHCVMRIVITPGRRASG